MKKIIFLFSLVLLAAGCNQAPASTNPSNNIINSNSPTPMTNPAPVQSNATTTPDLMAIVQVMDYGYKTTITVNGQDIGWQGPGGGGVRLFNKDNSTYAPNVTPEVMKQNGVLKLGENTITVTYQKIDPKSTDTLSVDFGIQGYSDSLFKLTSTKQSGSVEKTIDVESTQPSNFQPVIVQE